MNQLIKKSILSVLFLLLPSFLMSATRNVVPRATGEGSLGTPAKNWSSINTTSGTVRETLYVGTISASGAMVTTGSITAGFFYGDGSNLSGISGGSGGPQSSLAGSVATGPLNMNNYAINNATNMARLDGSSQTINMGSGIYQINSREFYTRGTTVGFITGVTGQENQFLIKGSASNSNRTFALDRNLSLTGWSLQDYATTVPASYQDIYLNPLGGDIGIATTSAVTPLDVKGTIKSTLLSDYGIMDYWAFGDSITAGAQATSSAFRYPNIIAEKMGYNLHNLGFSGAVLEETGIIDNVFATPVTSQTVSSILIGYNNSRYYSYDVARSTMFEASLNSALVYLALPDEDKYWTNHSSWNFTGTWVSKDSYGQTGKSKASSTPGDVAISTVNGKCLFLTVTSTASGGGKIFVTVDGSTVGNFNLAGALKTYGGTSAQRSYAPNTIVIPNLLNGNHEVKVTVLSGYCEINWIAGLQHHAGTDGIGVYVGNALRMTDYQYAVASPAGTIHTNRLFNKAIEKVVKRLAREGLNVTLVDVESKFKPDGGMMDADNVHPNNYGHNVIANAFLAKMSKGVSGQEKQGGNFLAGYTPPFSFGLEKSSIGASGLFTFDTENTRLGISSATPSTALSIKSAGDSILGALHVEDANDGDHISLDPNYGLIGNRQTVYLGNSKVGGDMFFRLSGVTPYDENTLYLSNYNNSVGIGTAAPITALHVARNNGDAILTLENTGNGNTSGINFTRERTSVGVGAIGGSIFMDSDVNTSNAFLYLQAQSLSANAGVRTPLSDYNGARIIIKGSSGTLAFETGSQERMNIDYAGNVAFGTRTAEGYVHIHSTSPESSKQISQFMVSTGSGRFSRTFDLTQASATFRVPIFGDGSNLTGVNATSGLDTLLASTYSYTSVSTLSVSFSDSQNLLIVAVTSAVLPNVFGEFPTVAFRFNGDSGNNYSFATDVGVSSISLLTNAGSPPGTPPGTPYFKKEITITLKDNAIQGSKNFMVESIHSSDPLTYNRYFLNAGTYNSNNRITSIDMFVSWAKNGGKLGANADRPSYIEVYKMGGISTATNNGIDVYDEEVMTVRRAQGINFKGSGVSVTQNGSTATVTITGSGGGGDQSSFAGSIATGTINFNNNDLINGATAYFKTVYVSSGNLGSPSFAFVGSTMTGIYYDPSGGGTINFVKSSLDAPVSVFSYDTSNLSMATGKSMQSSSYKFQNNNTSRITGANADSSVGIAFEPRGAVPASAFTDLTNRWGFYGATLPFYGAVNISSSQRSVGMTYLTVSSAPNYSGVFYQLTDSSMNVRVPVFMSSVTIGILENPVPSLTIIGGTAGTDLLRMKRPQGTGSEFGWSLAGGCLAFNDVTAGFIITNICGDSSLNELYLGQRGRTAATTRASVLSAETYNTIAGADIPSNNLTLRAGLGTGNGRPGNIAIQTGNLQASGSTVQSASTRVIVTGGEGNVGINIGSPQCKLHVVGDVQVSSISVSGTYTSTSGFIVGNSTITGNLHTTGKIVKRVVTVADGTSITPNIDTSDWVYQSNTQAAGTLTINAPTGSPSDGQALGIRIKNTNIQTYSFNGIYRDPTGIALPTATTGSGATNYLGFIYNLPDNKWDLTGSK